MPLSAFDHVRHLCETVGPRGSATENERTAHEYCARVFAELGLELRWQTFRTVGSPYRPFLVGAALLLLAWGLSFKATDSVRWLAAGLSTVAVASVFLELAFRNHPIRWILPKRRSQNVFARLPAAGERRRKIVVVAHADTHRTPWIWRSPATFKAYQRFMPVGMLAFVAVAGSTWWRLGEVDVPAGLELLAVALVALVLVLTSQAELSPHTVGANDNASGVSVLLQLAQEFQQAPLEHAELWFVATGCEEAGAAGAFAFVAEHRAALRDAVVLVVDNVAGAGTHPCLYRSEQMLRKLRYPQTWLKLAQDVAAAHPEWQVRTFEQVGAYTDGTPFLLAGVPCLTVVNHDANGWIPNWHHPHDVLENVDREALQATYDFVKALLVALDAEVGAVAT